MLAWLSTTIPLIGTRYSSSCANLSSLLFPRLLYLGSVAGVLNLLLEPCSFRVCCLLQLANQRCHLVSATLNLTTSGPGPTLGLMAIVHYESSIPWRSLRCTQSMLGPNCMLFFSLRRCGVKFFGCLGLSGLHAPPSSFLNFHYPRFTYHVLSQS